MAEDVPYIGSRISLISKSDIRYEGILFTIDMEQSSIALKDGKIISTCVAGWLRAPCMQACGKSSYRLLLACDAVQCCRTALRAGVLTDHRSRPVERCMSTSSSRVRREASCICTCKAQRGICPYVTWSRPGAQLETKHLRARTFLQLLTAQLLSL